MATGDGKAVSKARVHAKFREAVGARVFHARLRAEALREGYANPPPWMLPDGLDDPLDSAGVTAAFSRGEIGQNFAEVYQAESPGATGDAPCLKIQAGYLQAMERAFRLRHASGPRCAMMAAGRAKGHGDENGTLQNGVIRYVQDLLTAGQS